MIPDTNKPPDKPQTLDEFLWYTMHHRERIFVREKNKEGKWDSMSLEEISPQQWAGHVARWIEQGHLPVRVLTDKEVEERKQQ